MQDNMKDQDIKDDFLIHVCECIGDILPAPLIDIIVQYARQFYVFVNRATDQILFYDHFTRQIVDRQPMQTHDVDTDRCTFINGASNRTLFSYYVLADDHRIAVAPTTYNVNHIFGLRINRQKKKKQGLMYGPAIIDTVSSTSRSDVSTSDSLFSHTTVYSCWRRFDLATQKWDSIQIYDPYITHDTDSRESLNVTMIGPRSFFGIEMRPVVYGKVNRYRCFAYDGDSSESQKAEESMQKQKKEIISLYEIVGDNITHRRFRAMGLVKDDITQHQMIILVFHFKLVYIIKIKTHNPLTFSKPRIIKIYTKVSMDFRGGKFFILQDQLWIAFESYEGKLPHAYRFSFETMDWILSGTVPHELMNSHFQTII
jgi:hypothetical protein